MTQTQSVAQVLTSHRLHCVASELLTKLSNALRYGRARGGDLCDTYRAQGLPIWRGLSR